MNDNRYGFLREPPPSVAIEVRGDDHLSIPILAGALMTLVPLLYNIRL